MNTSARRCVLYARLSVSTEESVSIARQLGSCVSRAAQLLDDGASIAEVTRTLGCGRSQIDDRFPGRAWTRQRTIDHLRTLRHLVGNHSADQIDIAWRTIRRTDRGTDAARTSSSFLSETTPRSPK